MPMPLLHFCTSALVQFFHTYRKSKRFITSNLTICRPLQLQLEIGISIAPRLRQSTAHTHVTKPATIWFSDEPNYFSNWFSLDTTLYIFSLLLEKIWEIQCNSTEDNKNEGLQEMQIYPKPFNIVVALLVHSSCNFFLQFVLYCYT